jgi:hypothetical protein
MQPLKKEKDMDDIDKGRKAAVLDYEKGRILELNTDYDHSLQYNQGYARTVKTIRFADKELGPMKENRKKKITLMLLSYELQTILGRCRVRNYP